MASPIINSDAIQGETFLPGQIFVFGGFALQANSLGHLEQIESHAPGRQVRFGSLNYTTDIRGDLIFDGFKPQPSASHCLDGGVPSFDEMVDFALVEVDFDDPTTNVRGRRALAISKPTLRGYSPRRSTVNLTTKVCFLQANEEQARN